MYINSNNPDRKVRIFSFKMYAINMSVNQALMLSEYSPDRTARDAARSS